MKRILIIDNSIVIRSVIRNLFVDNQRLIIFEASSMEETEKLIKENDFFVVISNLFLNDSPNSQILELLEKENIPTIIFSSTLEKELLYKYSNILDYVLKDSNGFRYIYNLVSAMKFCCNESVLIVEDSNTVSNQIKQILEKLLLKVTIIEDGVKALEILNQEKKFSLIISDYEMPNLDGLELTRRIRALNSYKNSPIIIITKSNENELKTKFYKYGANDIILKPILQEELISKVINIFLNLKQIQEIKAFNNLIDKNIITSSTNIKGNIISVSEAFCKISGYTKEELLGKKHNILKHPDMSDSIYKELWETISKGKVWKGELKNLKKDRDYYWVKAIIEPNFSKEGKIIGYRAIRYDITDKKLIEIISITDGLTNIYNRRYFDEIFPKIINNAKRKNELVSFLFMDIDHFKQYNDNYGHQKGDDVLVKFATCLKESLHRSSDFAFRLGGEEFAIVYQTDTKEKAIEFANNIKNNIENLKIIHEFNSASPYITASMGLICKNADDIIVDEVYKEVDNLLYEAKRSGRNQIKVNELT
ncbi:MAG: diguanylate cyclase [Aliarcobacter sp.]|nr:diguanylate cyclase [Aliarcobacter sp.]